MLARLGTLLLGPALALGLAGCVEPAIGQGSQTSGAPAETDPGARADERDREADACEASWKAMEAAPAAPGTTALGARRAAFLGRARGAATVLLRPPEQTTTEAAVRERAKLDKAPKGFRISRLVGQLKRDKGTLREVVLSEGYLYAAEPEDAFELEARVKLTDLFDAPRLVLERGEDAFALERKEGKHPEYVFAEGRDRGKGAKILFLDRVREESAPVSPPLHRDILAFTRRTGHDRMEIVRLTDSGILARLRFGDLWARAVVTSEGAKLTLSCLAEPRAVRERVQIHLADTAWRRKAEANMRAAVSAMVDEALPFDRPREEEGPDKDGFLRPHWTSAYLSGRQTFEVEEKTYAVFLPDGRPHPPQVCVDFVLDSYERAAGAWFTPRGEKPRRIEGQLDFSDYDPENRRGVLGFGKFAEEHPELFAFRRFEGKERIPFADRDAFFAFLSEHTEEMRAGDVLAIQGLKRDNRVHQHAILLEEVDPLTGFPSGLADQMKAPRRRTWEGIMAEAPKRSLLYRARPKDVIFEKMAPQ
jgi:hypothetical protein